MRYFRFTIYDLRGSVAPIVNRKSSIVNCLLLLLVLIQSSTVFAQVFIEATVDKNVLTTDERLTLTVQMDAQPDNSPVLAGLQGFRVVGSSSASQISIVNGVTQASFAYRFQLQPTEVGSFQIEPIVVTIDGQQYETNPINVEVTQGQNPLPDDSGQVIVPPTELNGQDFYVEAEVDNATPYWGQQLLYIFRFYQAVEMLGRPSYTPPDFVGFWNQHENQQSQTLSDIAGRTYRITSLVTPLFATVTGERTIESAEFSLPDGRVLLTEPVTVDIQPLPEPQPENFSGAVGQFRVDAAVDKTDVAVGEAIAWRIGLSGVGNIDTLPEPMWPELDGWRSFEDKQTANTEFANGIVQGQRVYDRILIPSQPGEFVLPGLVYSYFNPATGVYEEATTEDIVFRVTGEGAAVDAEALEPSATVLLQPQRNVPRRLGHASAILQSPIFWSLWAVPLLAIVGDGVMRARKARGARALLDRKARAAWREAHAGFERGDSAEAILTTYLNTKYDAPFVGISPAMRSQQLREHNVAEDKIEMVDRIYEQAAGLKFGYGKVDAEQLLADTKTLIRQLEGR